MAPAGHVHAQEEAVGGESRDLAPVQEGSPVGREAFLRGDEERGRVSVDLHAEALGGKLGDAKARCRAPRSARLETRLVGGAHVDDAGERVAVGAADLLDSAEPGLRHAEESRERGRPFEEREVVPRVRARERRASGLARLAPGRALLRQEGRRVPRLDVRSHRA